VYTQRLTTGVSISATSVNDLLLASNSKTESDHAATQIRDKFAITDRGDTKWLLGCRVCRWRDKRLLTIDQEQFTTQILTEFGMEHSNAVRMPCPSYCLTLSMCPLNTKQHEVAAKLPYCTLVSKCMYIANCTRPDISYAVHTLTKFMSNYGTKHYEAAKHLLQYLQGMQS
jgi:hypothetical protein